MPSGAMPFPSSLCEHCVCKWGPASALSSRAKLVSRFLFLRPCKATTSCSNTHTNPSVIQALCLQVSAAPAPTIIRALLNLSLLCSEKDETCIHRRGGPGGTPCELLSKLQKRSAPFHSQGNHNTTHATKQQTSTLRIIVCQPNSQRCGMSIDGPTVLEASLAAQDCNEKEEGSRKQ